MDATLAYLASPYSHDDPEVRQARYDQTAIVAVKLVKKNYFVISPILHWHPVAITHELPTDFAFWKYYNTALIKRCEIFFVLRLKGWKESAGVLAEMKIAQEFNRMIDFLKPPR